VAFDRVLVPRSLRSFVIYIHAPIVYVGIFQSKMGTASIRRNTDRQEDSSMSLLRRTRTRFLQMFQGNFTVLRVRFGVEILSLSDITFIDSASGFAVG